MIEDAGERAIVQGFKEKFDGVVKQIAKDMWGSEVTLSYIPLPPPDGWETYSNCILNVAGIGNRDNYEFKCVFEPNVGGSSIAIDVRVLMTNVGHTWRYECVGLVAELNVMTGVGKRLDQGEPVAITPESFFEYVKQAIGNRMGPH
jgi:hypothetical protein